MRVVNHPDLETIPYAQLWSTAPFALEKQSDRWPPIRINCEKKGDERGVGASYKLDIGYPSWMVWEGQDGEVRLLKLVVAADISRLENPPGDQFLPIYPGVNVVEWETEPEPRLSPTPNPTPNPIPPNVPANGLFRTLLVTGANQPPLLVRAEGYDQVSLTVLSGSEQISLTISQRPPGWFDRLDMLLKEKD